MYVHTSYTSYISFISANIGPYEKFKKKEKTGTSNIQASYEKLEILDQRRLKRCTIIDIFNFQTFRTSLMEK